MKSKPFRYYITNCFILILPILLWNIALTNKLPETFQPDIFWANISPIIKYGENTFRIIVFILIALMPLSISSAKQKMGIGIYLIGLLFYFSSWLLLIYFPESTWSKSMAGFMAPAFTPILWLIGIWFIGDWYFFNLPINRYFFLVIFLIFLIFHNLHAYIIYTRIY